MGQSFTNRVSSPYNEKAAPEMVSANSARDEVAQQQGLFLSSKVPAQANTTTHIEA